MFGAFSQAGSWVLRRYGARGLRHGVRQDLRNRWVTFGRKQGRLRGSTSHRFRCPSAVADARNEPWRRLPESTADSGKSGRGQSVWQSPETMLRARLSSALVAGSGRQAVRSARRQRYDAIGGLPPAGARQLLGDPTGSEDPENGGRL